MPPVQYGTDPPIGIGIDYVTLPYQPASAMVWRGQVRVV
jgi:hypothetical protein